jgi:hypothetical protein
MNSNRYLVNIDGMAALLIYAGGRPRLEVLDIRFAEAVREKIAPVGDRDQMAWGRALARK